MKKSAGILAVVAAGIVGGDAVVDPNTCNDDVAGDVVVAGGALSAPVAVRSGGGLVTFLAR